LLSTSTTSLSSPVKDPSGFSSRPIEDFILLLSHTYPYKALGLEERFCTRTLSKLAFADVIIDLTWQHK